MKKLMSLLAMAALFLVGCAPADPADEEKPNGNDPPAITLSEYKEELEMEQNYVYMWNRDGIRGETAIVNFQTPSYAFQVDSKLGKIVSMGTYKSLSDTLYTECDFSSLADVKMSFSLREGGRDLPGKEVNGAHRIVDSGRVMQRMDYLNIRYEGIALEMLGRVEYAAMLDHFAINYQLHSKSDVTVDLSFKLEIAGATAAALENGRGYKMLDESGNGFAFLKPKDDDAVQIAASGGTIEFTKSEIAVKAAVHTGFGIIAVPIENNSEALLEGYLASENVTVTAEQIAPGSGPLPVSFDASRGVHKVDVSSVSVGTQSAEANRKRYERVLVNIGNAAENTVNVPVVFAKDASASVSITGMSPMLRDAETLEPIGEQVQISKNWHTFSGNTADFNYMSGDNPGRLYEGPWYNGYANIPVPAGGDSYEYTCAYGNWGETYAASHAQLCLIGWGGNMLWDQSALGSWGESVTYDPDIGLNRSMIDDVRPFLVTSPQGNNNQFDWTGNVGGGDFLNYLDMEDSAESRIIDQKVTYTTQAPNLTQVSYRGITDNGKIAAEIGINLGRTDDIVRNYYTIKYTFLEDVEFGRLSLFKIAADAYSDNFYTKYAYGDANGITEENISMSGQDGYRTETKDAAGDDFWFVLYNSTSADENGDVMFIVRDYKAEIGGTTYTRPGYRFYGTSNGSSQASCELTAPAAAGNKIPAGSTIEMLVEYDIIPGDAETYYGQSSYLVQSKELFGTATAAYQQVVGGAVTATAAVGEVTSRYPVRVNCADGETAAEITLTGGLGYVPLVFDGLPSYKGYKLQVKEGGSWKDVDQSVLGNDWWQAYRNPATGKYQLAFNVVNTDGLNFGDSKDYRLIKA